MSNGSMLGNGGYSRGCVGPPWKCESVYSFATPAARASFSQRTISSWICLACSSGKFPLATSPLSAAEAMMRAHIRSAYQSIVSSEQQIQPSSRSERPATGTKRKTA